MKLSADMFKQIIASLKSERSSSRGHEKRTEGRVGLRCSVDVIPHRFGDKGARAVTVWVRDMSVNGIGLVASTLLELNVEFVVPFIRDGHKPLSVRYKVRYVKKISRDLYSIGASFERFEDDAAARALMGHLHGKIHPPQADTDSDENSEEIEDGAPALVSVPAPGTPGEGQPGDFMRWRIK
jgi:hypothetical protein